MQISAILPSAQATTSQASNDDKLLAYSEASLFLKITTFAASMHFSWLCHSELVGHGKLGVFQLGAHSEVIPCFILFSQL